MLDTAHGAVGGLNTGLVPEGEGFLFGRFEPLDTLFDACREKGGETVCFGLGDNTRTAGEHGVAGAVPEFTSGVR